MSNDEMDLVLCLADRISESTFNLLGFIIIMGRKDED